MIEATLGVSEAAQIPEVPRGLFSQATARLRPEVAQEIAPTLGHYAKVAQWRLGFAGRDEPDQADLLLLAEAAVHAFRGVRASRAAPHTPRPAARRDLELSALSVWVLAALKAQPEHDDLLLAQKRIQNAPAQMVRRRGWISMLAKERSADIRWLLTPHPAARAAVASLLDLGEDPAAILEVLNRAPAHEVFIQDPAAATVAAFTPSRPDELWRPLDALSPDVCDLVREVAHISEDRGDLLVTESAYLAVEWNGVLDALLTFAVSTVSNARNKSWHERSLVREVTQTWRPPARVRAGMEWADTDWTPDNEKGVQGEFDALVTASGLVVDYQAKSARSRDPSARTRVPVTDALRQHEVFAARTGGSVLLLHDGRDTTHPSRIEPMDVSQADVVHITVGTDVVQRWAVGGSVSAGGLARVLTTLDHLRIVNHYVPEALRPVYWLDRSAQEHEPLRFVDEIDFLAKWHRLATCGASETPLRVFVGDADDPTRSPLVMADDSELERDLAMRGSTMIARDRVPEINRLRMSTFAPILRRNMQSAPVTSLLEMFEMKASPHYWRLARALVGNVPRDVADARRAERTTILHQGLESIFVAPSPLRGDEEMMLRRQRVAVGVVRGRSGWRVALAPSTDDVGRGLRARFRMP